VIGVRTRDRRTLGGSVVSRPEAVTELGAAARSEKGGARAERLDLPHRLALRPKEAAEALGVSERTLRKWMRDEGLPYFRVDGAVLLPRAELERWMLERTGSQQRTDEIAEQILQDF
jgi:excisionase family DNA binding protein